jgi:hypothetical protein
MEWLEILIRISLFRHGTGPDTDVSDCVQAFVTEDLIPTIPAEILEMDSNYFRCHRLYNHRVDEIIKSNKLVLRGIFERYKGSTDKKRDGLMCTTMDMKDWIVMISTLGLHELGLNQREAQIIFFQSIPMCSNELLEPQKAEHLQYIHFLEAICRLADAIDVPNAQVPELTLTRESMHLYCYGAAWGEAEVEGGTLI